MSEELLINITPQETRVAAVENGVLQEVHIERSQGKGIVGNIYRGKIVRVLPGMQAAFVEIGLERTGFLHAADIAQSESDTVAAKDSRNPSDGLDEPAATDTDSGQSDGSPSNGNGDKPLIANLVREGQSVLVQVVKDPIGSKGARLTTQIAIPSRNLVYLPGSDHIGVSQRIMDPDERDRLKQAVHDSRASLEINGGFIVRTAGESAIVDDMIQDMKFLTRIWERTQKRRSEVDCGLVHEDLPLAMRTLRDLVKEDVEKIRIDSRETYQKARDLARELVPEVIGKMEYYPGERPIFDLYSVEDEIQRAMDRMVPLKSGGYLIIDQTEAMTTIDVNTGAFVGRRNLEETLFKTNLEAAQCIARQLRLRNLGGIIIIDFIDMEQEEHRRQVMRALEKALSRDVARAHIADMSVLGLVEITRKRTRESLERMLTQPCPCCAGRGVQKTPQTICYEIFREILREARQFEANGFMVLASQVVIDMLLDEESTGLADLQEFIKRPITMQVEPAYSQEVFDVVLI
ncbi:MAG: ribonuclease G [marine bacterium B5-7]|nr:MAG: ribonuclease G [marine bacterium B5-7]